MFGFDFMNSVFPMIFTVMFVGIFIMFIVTAVRGHQHEIIFHKCKYNFHL